MRIIVYVQVRDVPSTDPAVTLVKRTKTVSAADTRAPENAKPVSRDAGGFIITISPTAAPEIVTEVSEDDRVASDAGSTAIVPDLMYVIA